MAKREINFAELMAKRETNFAELMAKRETNFAELMAKRETNFALQKIPLRSYSERGHPKNRLHLYICSRKAVISHFSVPHVEQVIVLLS